MNKFKFVTFVGFFLLALTPLACVKASLDGVQSGSGGGGGSGGGNGDGGSGSGGGGSSGSNSAPTVTNISPSSGSTAGGVSVTVTGTGFLTGAVTTMGGSTCTSPTIGSTSISCTTPAHASGTVDVVVTNTDAQSGTLSSGFTFQGPIVSSWSFVDGNTANGLNFNAVANNAKYPQLTVFDSKLYSIWQEQWGGTYQIRVKVFNGNDSSPSWSFIDGNANASLVNKNTGSTNFNTYPQLTSFNSKLYSIFAENNGGGVTQIRASVYNGNDSSPSWSIVDGNAATGLNQNTAQAALNPQATAFNSKLYAIWHEVQPAGVNQIRVRVFDGNDSSPIWSFVDGNAPAGLNKAIANAAVNGQLTVFNSKLYATWQEGTPSQIRMVVYNGNDSSPSWSFIDGNAVGTGLNKDGTVLATSSQLTVFNSKLYGTWDELSNGTGKQQIRMVVYDGNDSSPSWTFVDGNGVNGLNKSTSRDGFHPHLTVSNLRLYATWDEKNTAFSMPNTRIAVYNGNDSSPSWSFVDGNGANGINFDTTIDAGNPQITDFNSKLYGSWFEISGGAAYQIRAAVGQ